MKPQLHGYSVRPGNGFGDVLIRRLNRLPLPSLTLLDNMAQTWEGEMKGEYQGLISCSPMEELTPGAHGLFGPKVDKGVPVGIFQMDGMERRIGAVQKLFAARGNG